MNYQHSYHAGSAADVVKHMTLILLLQQLIKKDKPLFYLDTHAGEPIYALTDKAQKTGEYRRGISQLWQGAPTSPLIAKYLGLVRQYNTDNLRYYPGSTAIAQALLRPDDRLVFCDKNPLIASTLKKGFSRDRRITIQTTDGYPLLKALLPPKERRGLVFIDPPYEEAQEFTHLVDYLKLAYQRWNTGIYAVWYPIKDRRAVKRFHDQMHATNIRKILTSELCVFPDDVPQRLNGTGMLIINPPWQLDAQLRKTLLVLLPFLQQHTGAKTQTYWLQGE